MQPTTKIPPKILTKIIPSHDLSISDIQNFPLPNLAISKHPLPHIQNFLSPLTPNITNVEEIVLLPTLSEDLLKTFSNALKLDSHSHLFANICMVTQDFV